MQKFRPGAKRFNSEIESKTNYVLASIRVKWKSHQETISDSEMYEILGDCDSKGEFSRPGSAGCSTLYGKVVEVVYISSLGEKLHPMGWVSFEKYGRPVRGIQTKIFTPGASL
jgi:hypothetical protein